MRNFLYLLRTNGLLLNNRLNTIDPTVSPHCTFCRILNRQTAPRDSFLHFFYDCAITNRLLQRWCGLFEPPLQLNDFSFRNFYWYCTVYSVQRIMMQMVPHRKFSLRILLNTYYGNSKKGKKFLTFLHSLMKYFLSSGQPHKCLRKLNSELIIITYS